MKRFLNSHYRIGIATTVAAIAVSLARPAAAADVALPSSLNSMASVTATNGATVTLSNSVVRLDCSGQATGLTNAITLAAASSAPRVVDVVNVGSNAFSLASSGLFKSPALVVLANGSARFVAGATNQWYGK